MTAASKMLIGGELARAMPRSTVNPATAKPFHHRRARIRGAGPGLRSPPRRRRSPAWAALSRKSARAISTRVRRCDRRQCRQAGPHLTQEQGKPLPEAQAEVAYHDLHALFRRHGAAGGDRPGRRRPARRGALQAARCRRRYRAVELPGADRDEQGRPRADPRQHHRDQARARPPRPRR